MAVFVTMGREKTLTFCHSISNASVHARRMEEKKRDFWSEMFGSVALSYARVGDPATTAALLRASAQLGLTHPWLTEAECFLLDQQTPEGCFGIFARELALVGSDHAPWMPHLSLSVEVLWALAEVTALHASYLTSKRNGANRNCRRINFSASSERAHRTILQNDSLSPLRPLITSTLSTNAP
jgi:hypothetical protein